MPDLDKEAVAALIATRTSAHEKAELTTLYNAMTATLAVYQQENTAARLRDYEAAREALKKLVEQLAVPAQIQVPCHANLLALVRHLQESGYKIKKSKAYTDRDRGLLRVNADGTIGDAEARAYAATLDRVADKTGVVEENTAKKLAREVERLTLQNEKLRFDMERDKREWVKKDDVETDLALRCAVFEAGIKHALQSRMSEVVRMVGGKIERTQAAVDVLCDAVDNLLNDYARAEAVEVEV